MWFIVVEVEQETSAPPPKKNPGSAPAFFLKELQENCREYKARNSHILQADFSLFFKLAQPQKKYKLT